MTCLGPFLLLATVLLFLLFACTNSREGGGPNKTLESWQSCDVFLAPSSTGWGVFAARDYEEGELVDAAPLVIRTWDDRLDGITKATVLDDYVYGYVDDTTGKYSPVVLFGYSMFFNHHPEPNVVVSLLWSCENSSPLISIALSHLTKKELKYLILM